MEQYLTHACGGCGGKKKKKAFTLIELLIVITIIGILAVALLPRVMGAPARARDVDRKADLAQLATIMESYMSDNGTYYIATAGVCTDDSGFVTALAPYLAGATIADPVSTNTLTASTGSCTGGGYYYRSLSANGVANTSFLLVAQTEADGVGAGYTAAGTTGFDKTGYIEEGADASKTDSAEDANNLYNAYASLAPSVNGLDNVYMVVR